MLVTKTWNPLDSGGPFVFHSEWWLREHWGRAFEIDFLERGPSRPRVARPRARSCYALAAARSRPANCTPATMRPETIQANECVGRG